MQFYIAIADIGPMVVTGHCEINQKKRYWKYQIKIYYVHFRPLYRPCLPSYYATFQIKDTTQVMVLPFDYIGYKRLLENKRFPNHRWYSDATWEGGWLNGLEMGFTYNCYANRWRMCSISSYFRNSSASINNVTNVNYDIDLQKMYMYSCKMPQMLCLTR